MQPLNDAELAQCQEFMQRPYGRVMYWYGTGANGKATLSRNLPGVPRRKVSKIPEDASNILLIIEGGVGNEHHEFDLNERHLGILYISNLPPPPLPELEVVHFTRRFK
nr:hypothetical protein K-LCC10_0261 [Kaumoebavirus]